MSGLGRAVARAGSSLAAAALRAERFGERRAWRLGQAARQGVQGLHEGLTRLAHAAGLRECTPAEVEASWNSPVAGLPPYAAHEAPAPGEPAGGRPTLRAGEAPIGAAGNFPIAALTFRTMPGGSPSMYRQFLFYSLDDVERLRAEGARSADPAALDTALALARRWCEVCLHTERTPHVWDDHIAAVRALVFARLWCTLRERRRDSTPASDRALLAEAMARHARRLALPDFYRSAHNHGVTQAVALLVAGIALSAHPESPRWIEIGAARLEAQARDNVTERGVHREHSPFYHFYVLRQMLEGARWAETAGVRFAEPFRAKLRAMLLAGTHMLQPDGSLAALGDTNRSSYAASVESFDKEAPSPELEAFRFGATGGRRGARPPSRLFRDDDGGILIARSGWGDARPFHEEQFVSFRLGTAPTSHVHADVLSFTWQRSGTDLVVDPGGPFGYGTPWRRDYFLRALAHNTVTADDRDGPVGRASVERFAEGRGWFALDTRYGLGEGAVHRRAFFAHDDGLLLLVDRLAAREPKRWTQRFHLAPPFTTDARLGPGDILASTPNGGATLRIASVGPVPPAAAIARAEESPPRGWVCSGDLSREGCASVSFTLEGADALFATLLVAGGSGAPEAAIPPFERAGEGEPFTIRLEIGGASLVVSAPADAPAAFTLTNPGGVSHA